MYLTPNIINKPVLHLKLVLHQVLFALFLLYTLVAHLEFLWRTVHGVFYLVSDVNPLLSLGDLEEAEDVVQDTPNSYLMCVSENWDKQSKELTIGLVVNTVFSGFLEYILRKKTNESWLEHMMLGKLFNRFRAFI